MSISNPWRIPVHPTRGEMSAYVSLSMLDQLISIVGEGQFVSNVGEYQLISFCL
jgi:hypothetical protein